MLTSVLWVLVKTPVKKKIYRKRKKKINVLTVFFISYKSDVKTFLKWIVSECPLVSMTHLKFIRGLNALFLNFVL